MLLCFALKDECRRLPRHFRNVLLTGVGAVSASRALGEALARSKPRLVLTCGFAGALNPDFTVGTVVFEADAETGLAERLLQCGAISGRFHMTRRIIVRAAEKQSLHEQTGADAVEMESEVIRSACRGAGVPSATIRAISDTAAEDMPLDFNRVLRPDQSFDYLRLAWEAVKTPTSVPGLLRLGRHARLAAKSLAKAITSLFPN